MKVTCELIQAGVPTGNGRIYRREILESLVEQANTMKDQVYVTSGFSNGSQPAPADIVGTATDFSLTDDGMITATISLLPRYGDLSKIMDHLDFSPMMFGNISEDDHVVQGDVRLGYFALTPKEKT